MKQTPQFLEIIIQQEGDYFIAKSPLFPFCIGKAKTKKTALKRLRLLIAKTLYKKIDKVLIDLFDNDKFSEIIVNPNQINKCQHYLYSLKKNNQWVTILLKLYSLNITTNYLMEPYSPNINYNEHLLARKNNFQVADMNDILSEMLVSEIENTILLGYPICLN
tara:strand:- start:704 stop:1192 length:489 start_codon:yes stop_codon:yes gene_type:complete